jgi:hypothetical protein
MLLPMVLNVTLSGYGLAPLLSIDSQEELLLTNMSQELFLLAVFGKEFFPRKTRFLGIFVLGILSQDFHPGRSCLLRRFS